MSSQPSKVPEVSTSILARPRVKRWAGLCVDGLPFLAFALVLTTLIGFLFGFHWAIPFGILSLWIAWFFRDPNREVPSDPQAILAPADGKVIDAQRMSYPKLLEGKATRVSIFMSIFNVHINRSPFGGVVRTVEQNPGKFFAAFEEKASISNEQTAVVLDTDRGVPLLFIQIAGLIARRIICRLKAGERLEKGERFGLIRFGSRMDIYLPDSVKIFVKPGENVYAGRSVLGRFT